MASRELHVVVDTEDVGELLGAYSDETRAEIARLRFCDEQSDPETARLNVTVLSLLLSDIDKDLWV